MSYSNAKKSLGISPGRDYVPDTTSVPGSRAPQLKCGWSPETEAPPIERFQNAGPFERHRCAALDRNVNESLILRLKTYATEAFVTEALGNSFGLFRQGE